MTHYQVVWRGPVLRASGIGIASREYVLALHRQGVDVKVDTKMKRPMKIGSGQLKKLTSFIKKS
ncbi:hypothetical protein [Aneurinibacillus terranovensis]|uniref:hypothetical protein n=1 Tax=Aneurinibacillus terranovensis TaxID=278991 RepID=UPI00047F318D|nr:hypothetical protein [Aneurinibacillus terranovensis]